MPTERKFGRNQSPHDPRDYNLKWFIPRGEQLPKEKMWDFPADSLDQGETPHCVGFSMAGFGINLPTYTPYTNKDGHKFYYLCKIEDGEPELENGSTLRSAAKVLQNTGAIEAYAFARDKQTILWWLRNRGPIIMGTLWTDTMMEPGEGNILDTSGHFLGGHAWIANGIREDDYIRGQNSWGEPWGDNGAFYIHIDDFMELFSYGGEALAAVELEKLQEKHQGFFHKLWESILQVLRDLFA